MVAMASFLPPALSKRRFRVFAIGQAVSIVGGWIQQIALSWLIYRLSGSVFLLGVSGFLTQIPFLIFSPFAGALTDRVRRVRMLIIVNCVLASLASLLAIMAAIGVDDVRIYLAIALCTGTATSFETPARQSLLSIIVEERALLPSAIGVNSMMFNIGRIIGPTIAGVLLLRLPESWCFALNAVSFGAIIIALIAMRLPDPSPIRTDNRKGIALGETITYLKTHPAARYLLPTVTAIAVFALPYQHTMPSIAASFFNGNASTLGLLMSSVGAGALITAIVLAMQSGSRVQLIVVRVAPFVVALTLIAFSQSRNLTLSMILLAILGGAILMTSASTNTIMQQSVPDAWRGRVIGVYVMSFVGMAPLGNLMTGAIAERFGIGPTLAFNGIMILLCVGITQLRFAANPDAMERLKTDLGS
jgi:MFS family permease